MKIVSPASISIPMGLVLLATTWAGRTGLAQERASAASRFFAEHGVNDMAPAVRDVLDVFLEAQSDYHQGQYARAADRLGAFWKAHPTGTKQWATLNQAGLELGLKKGVFLGTPPCYLRIRRTKPRTGFWWFSRPMAAAPTAPR